MSAVLYLALRPTHSSPLFPLLPFLFLERNSPSFPGVGRRGASHRSAYDLLRLPHGLPRPMASPLREFVVGRDERDDDVGRNRFDCERVPVRGFVVPDVVLERRIPLPARPIVN